MLAVICVAVSLLVLVAAGVAAAVDNSKRKE